MRIVVAADVSERSAAALRFAAGLARDSADEVLAIHGMNPAEELLDAPPARTAEEAAEQQVDQRLRDFQGQIERLGLAGRVRPMVELIYGPDVAELVEGAAAEWNADLIVVGSGRASGLGGYLLGSVAQKLLRIAKRPVTIVPPHEPESDAG